tara:strand:+ start:1948 stop:2805 length:858 start_codon:yes stop_codon:yes gene_type:complete
MAKEEKANPYNMKKSWHKVEEKPFVSSNSMFFPDTKTENVEDEGNKIEEQQAQEEVVEKDKPYKRPNYKKRYDDLKKHYDSKLNEFKQREIELIEQAQEGKVKYTPPKSEEELKEFKEKYPDVYDVVETVANLQSENKAKHLEEKIKLLQEREQQLIKLDSEKELKANHPDFDEIRNSDEFHEWAKSQPESIQDWIYKNTADPGAASRALDLFKSDMGFSNKEKPSKSSNKKASAANMVSAKTTNVEPKQAKIWTEQEILALSPAEYDKLEKEIDKAWEEGRINR